MTAELSIYEKFIDAGIPHYTGADSFALNGAFVGYGVDYANLGQKTADMIADILIDNADPQLLKPLTMVLQQLIQKPARHLDLISIP